MSLILDALKRSQQERDSVNDIPGIETYHQIESVPPTNGWRRSFPWLSLLIALVVIVYLLMDGRAKTATPAVAEPPGVEVLAPEAASVARTSADAMPLSTEQPSAAVMQAEDISEQDAEATAAVADLYEKKAQQQRAVPEAVNEVTAQEKVQANAAVVDKPTVTEQSVDIEEMIALAKAETANAALAEHPVPFLSELSQSVKDKIPTIYYSQHDFSPGVPQSSVTLNGETLREGSELASAGLTVDEILTASVVLSHRGTQFRLKALNSWINL